MKAKTFVRSEEERFRSSRVVPGYVERPSSCDAKLVLLERSHAS